MKQMVKLTIQRAVCGGLREVLNGRGLHASPKPQKQVKRRLIHNADVRENALVLERNAVSEDLGEAMVTVDSGAGASVANPRDLPGVPLKPSAGSQRGQLYVGPGGEVIANLGELPHATCSRTAPPGRSPSKALMSVSPYWPFRT